MHALLDWGIDVVLRLQQFSPALDLPFSTLTFFGGQTGFMLLLPFVYWCLDRRIGSRLIVLFLVSAYLNSAAKEVLGQPRPFDYDPRVKMLAAATGGGLPSGHTQSAVVFWGYLARAYRRGWLWVLGGVLVFGVALSRVYLGVHFPTDLLGGLVMALLLLTAEAQGRALPERWRSAWGFRSQMTAAVTLPALLITACPGGDGQGLAAGAVLWGMGVGFLLERRGPGFDPGGAWRTRLLRYGLGIVVLFALQAGLRAAFGGLEPAGPLRALRYALVGLWGSWGAPWLFVRLKLARTGPVPDPGRRRSDPVG